MLVFRCWNGISIIVWWNKPWYCALTSGDPDLADGQCSTMLSVQQPNEKARATEQDNTTCIRLWEVQKYSEQVGDRDLRKLYIRLVAFLSIFLFPFLLNNFIQVVYSHSSHDHICEKIMLVHCIPRIVLASKCVQLDARLITYFSVGTQSVYLSTKLRGQ